MPSFLMESLTFFHMENINLRAFYLGDNFTDNFSALQDRLSHPDLSFFGNHQHIIKDHAVSFAAGQLFNSQQISF